MTILNRKLAGIIVLLQLLAIGADSQAQGWVAEVSLDLNHSMYAYERITSAAFTYSGVTGTGTSATSVLQLTLKGTGSPSGSMKLTIAGVAFEPYDRDMPWSESISASFSGTFTKRCSRGYFQGNGTTSDVQVSISIIVYPRMYISAFTNLCNEVILTTETCSSTFKWEVSDRINDGYRVIEGKTSPSISVTRQELASMGFSDPAGRKYFRVTGRSGTTSALQAVDIYYPPPSASFESQPPRCHGAADGVVIVNIQSANPTVIDDFVVTLFDEIDVNALPRQISVTDQFTAEFMDIPAGTYRIRIENNSSRDVYGACWSDHILEPIADPTPVTISSLQFSDYHQYEISCNGGSDGSMEVTAAGGTGIYPVYEWIPSVSTTRRAENLPQGTYQVRVKDNHGCVSETRTGSLSAPPMLEVALLSLGGRNGFDVSCPDARDGRLAAEVSGGVAEYTFAWTGGTTTPEVQNLPPGPHSVTVTDRNGCAVEASAVLVSPEPIDFSIGELSAITCAGSRSGTLEVRNPLNTIGAVYYEWSTGERTKEITEKPSGTYAATVSDEQGCSATREHVLVEPLPWTLDVMGVSDYNGAAIRCYGESNGAVAAVVNDGDQDPVKADHYVWYQGETVLASGAEMEKLEGLPAGVYRAVITYNGICGTEKTFTLAEPSPVTANILTTSSYNGVPISCNGAVDGALMASGAGGTGTLAFTWSTGATGPLLNAVCAGMYRVVVRDANQCEAEAETILDQPPPVEVRITMLSDYHGQALTCAGSADGQLSATATGGVSGYTFHWSTGHASSSLTGVGAGEYYVTTTDRNGCTSTASTVVRDPAPVQADISTFSNYNGYGVTCAGAADGYLECTASGGSGNYTFAWKQDGGATPRLEHVAAGTYTVQVRDENNCTDSATHTLVSPEALTLEAITVKNVSCSGGNDGQVDLRASGGSGGYGYAAAEEGYPWNDQPQLEQLRAGRYDPVVRDMNECAATTIVTITEPSPILIRFEGVEPALCGDPRGSASALITGGTSDYRYRWTDADNTLVSNDPKLSAVTAGIYTLSVLDARSCEAVAILGITSTDGPVSRVSDLVPATCHDSADGKAALIIEGDGPFTLRWDDGQTTAEAIGLKRGNHLAVVSDRNGCTAVETIPIEGPDRIQVHLEEKEDVHCHGDCNGKLVVSASGGNGGYLYTWETRTGAELLELCAGPYPLQVTDEKGCAVDTLFSIGEPEPLLVALQSMKSPTCYNGCDGALEIRTSGGSGEITYRWDNGMTASVREELCSGTYSITVIDGHGCTSKEAYALENPKENILDIGGSLVLCRGQTHTLDAGDGWEQYSWTSSTGVESKTRRLTIDQAGWYALEAITGEGCVSRDTFRMETSTDLLEANFLIASQAMAGDTIVVVDVSWPWPDSIQWILPAGMSGVENFGEIIFGVFDRGGEYTVALEAALGECRDEIRKSITILEDEVSPPASGRLGADAFVKAFTLYPNPTNGAFDITVEFMEESSVVFTIWHTATARKLLLVQREPGRVHREHVDLRPLTAGLYTLRMDHARGTRFVRFVVR